MRALDLFAGIGWGIACHQLHIHECGADTMTEVVQTRDGLGMCTPYRDVTVLPDSIAADIAAEILIASPPCQTFSVAGIGHGREALDEVLRRTDDMLISGRLDRSGGDPRTWLVIEPLRIALGSHPEFITFEQVPAVLPYWEVCAGLLAEAGYDTWTGLLNAEAYGVPQTRKRAFLMASNSGAVTYPEPTHSSYHRDGRMDSAVRPWISMADALGWGMTDRPAMTVMSGGADTGGAEPFGNGARQSMERERLAGRWKVRTSMGTPKSDGRNGSHVLDPTERPAHTVTTKAGEWTIETLGDEAGSRRITAHEAKILQSFPPTVKFAGATPKQFQQIGNAVPPRMAQHVLSALLASAGLNVPAQVA